MLLAISLLRIASPQLFMFLYASLLSSFLNAQSSEAGLIWCVSNISLLKGRKGLFYAANTTKVVRNRINSAYSAFSNLIV